MVKLFLNFQWLKVEITFFQIIVNVVLIIKYLLVIKDELKFQILIFYLIKISKIGFLL